MTICLTGIWQWCQCFSFPVFSIGTQHNWVIHMSRFAIKGLVVILPSFDLSLTSNLQCNPTCLNYSLLACIRVTLSLRTRPSLAEEEEGLINLHTYKFWSPWNFGGMNLIGWWLFNYISAHEGTCSCTNNMANLIDGSAIDTRIEATIVQQA